MHPGEPREATKPQQQPQTTVDHAHFLAAQSAVKIATTPCMPHVSARFIALPQAAQDLT
jgi:hypothetical protein